MSADATTEPALVQPDYMSKPVTALKDAVIAAISFVSKGANGQRWLLFKSGEDPIEQTLTNFTPLIKKANGTPGDFTTAFIVVGVPGEVDLQKDVWGVDELEKSAHEFLKSGGLLNLEHQSLQKMGSLVESYLAPANFEIKTPDGEIVKVAEGSWIIGVEPNDEIKQLIKDGQITGMSVQGSARREPVTKADKSDRPIAKGTVGAGILKLQHTLGVEETNKYDDATEAALIKWMHDKGVPGTPTVATLKMCISEVAPAPEAPQPAISPNSPTAAPTEKADTQAYSPGIYDATPPVPIGADGVDTINVTVDSDSEDLKALIAKSIREGNEDLSDYMEQHFEGASVGDLYNSDISHADLWFMISKFIIGTGTPSIDENGEYEAIGSAPADPAVQKDSEVPAAVEEEAKPAQDIVAGDVVKHKGNGAFVESVEGDNVVLLRADRAGKEIRVTVPKSEVELITAKVEKSDPIPGGSHLGSMGGHSPLAQGKIKYIVRSFGSWAGNLQRVAAKRLLLEHPEVVHGDPARANALAAWLKDQYMGTTHWRNGNGGLHKSLEEVVASLVEKWDPAEGAPAKTSGLHGVDEAHLDAMVKGIATDLGHDHAAIQHHIEHKTIDQYLVELHGDHKAEDLAEVKASEVPAEAPVQSPVHKVIEIMQSDAPVEKIASDISDVLSGPDAPTDPSLEALNEALIHAAHEVDDNQRISDVEQILTDFARWVQHSHNTQVSGATATEKQDSQSQTFLNKGEEMSRTRIDEATAHGLSTAVNFITNALNGTSSEEVSTDAGAEVEKAGPAFGSPEWHALHPSKKKAPVVDAEDATEAPESGKPDAEDRVEAPEAEAAPDAKAAEDKAEAPEDGKPDAEDAAEVKSELDDEGDDVSEEELLQVMNHLVEEVDALSDRIASLEQLGSKLDTVGKLAKALTEQDTTSERIDAIVADLTEVSKKLEKGVTADELQSVVKRLDDIASKPSRSSAIPVDFSPAGNRQAVAKQDKAPDPAGIWGNTFR